jgi:hypothetical protein
MFVSETNLRAKIFAFDSRLATGGRDRRAILRASAMTQPGAEQNTPMRLPPWHQRPLLEESTAECYKCFFDPHDYAWLHRITGEFVDGSRWPAGVRRKKGNHEK